MAEPQSFIKQPTESRAYTMDFAPNMSTGETITSVTSVVSTPTGLTVGSNTISGQRAQVRLSGGTAGIAYNVTFIVVTSLSNTLEAEGILVVTDSKQ